MSTFSQVVVEAPSISYTLHAVIKFKNISLRSSRILSANFSGDWNIRVGFPSEQEQTAGAAQVQIRLSRPTFTMAMGGLNLTLQLQSLYGAQNVTEQCLVWAVGQQLYQSKEFCPWNALWAENSAVRRDNGFQVVVDVTSKTLKRPVVSDPTMLRNISRLMLGSETIQLKFLLFSRRRVDPDIAVVGAKDPLPVYATSWQLANQCDYFNTILGTNGFSESKIVPFDEPPAELWVAGYDYDSDSDLDYFSEDDDGEPLSESTQISTIVEDNPARPEDGGTYDLNMDHEVEDDNDIILGPPAELENMSRIGQVVAIKDVAYVTWRAMIYYLCTSQVAFAPLTCHGLSRRRSATQRTLGLPPRPSAKSMYRLADKLGLDDLSELALEHIRSQLSTDTILRELCSRFTSQYQAVRDVELAFTFRHWDELKNSETFREVVSDIADGVFPHAKDVLISLLTH